MPQQADGARAESRSRQTERGQSAAAGRRSEGRVPRQADGARAECRSRQTERGQSAAAGRRGEGRAPQQADGARAERRSRQTERGQSTAAVASQNWSRLKVSALMAHLTEMESDLVPEGATIYLRKQKSFKKRPG